MATSPIYSWPEPDNTDLVKNGALAIRTLGNAIDTTMATMVPKTIVDAKGDLIAGTAADTAARLAVGNNGETLVADSSTATGLRYTAGTVQANPVLNSAMQVWQRGTSIALSASTAYTSDRWQGRTGSGAQTISRQLTGDTTNLPFIQYCARVGRNSGNTGTGIILFEQSLETINTIPFVGKTVTISYYARKGANFSGASDILYGALVTGTGTDQNVNAYTGGANTILGSSTLTTTWQRFTYTGAIPTTVNEMALQFNYTPTGTAGAADYFEVTGVQVDIGSVALPFRTYAGTIQGELAACQRYYQRITSPDYGPFIFMTASSATNLEGLVQFITQMRTSPTFAKGGTAMVYPPLLDRSSPTQAAVYATTTGKTAQYTYKNNNGSGDGTSYLEFSAEL